jgi:hypothetical protein
MDDNVKDQLNRIELSLARMERAIFGEVESGLSGLVHDMKEMKVFREKQNLKSAGVAGGITVALLAIKSIVTKLFP